MCPKLDSRSTHGGIHLYFHSVFQDDFFVCSEEMHRHKKPNVAIFLIEFVEHFPLEIAMLWGK